MKRLVIRFVAIFVYFASLMLVLKVFADLYTGVAGNVAQSIILLGLGLLAGAVAWFVDRRYCKADKCRPAGKDDRIN